MSEGQELDLGREALPCFVVTADQRDSRHQPDAVPALLEQLAARPTAPDALPFERAAGDEVQGVLTSGTEVVQVLELLLRSGRWRAGIGVGTVEHPLPDSVRAARGPAFIAARRAVERSHRGPQPLALEANTDLEHATDPGLPALAHAEAALWLWAGVLTRRTAEGWEVVDRLAEHSTQREVAEALGVSPSAVSQRLRTAGATEADRGAALCAALLDAAAAGLSDPSGTLGNGPTPGRPTPSHPPEDA